MADMIRSFEPAPAAFLVRQSFHPWLVVAVTCIGAFIGQLDASIVQLALPALQGAFQGVGERRPLGRHRLPAGLCFLPARVRPGSAKCTGRKVLYLIGFAIFGGASLLLRAWPRSSPG